MIKIDILKYIGENDPWFGKKREIFVLAAFYRAHL